MKNLKIAFLLCSLMAGIITWAQQHESIVIQQLRALHNTKDKAILTLANGHQAHVAGQRIPANPPKYQTMISDINFRKSTIQNTCSPIVCTDYTLDYWNVIQRKVETIKITEFFLLNGKWEVLHTEVDGDLYSVSISPL